MTTSKTYRRRTSFTTVLLIELWERFGYYGMQALIVYFMVQRLNFGDQQANLTWSAASALIYISPAIGGFIGDRVLGAKRCMLIGTIILTFGYILMTLPAENPTFLFAALGVIVVGNGFFKSNASNLIRNIYAGDSKNLDSAFTLYYMAVNVGSTVSMLLTPWIKDYVNTAYHNEMGWHAAFAVCALGLIVGMANYFLMAASLKRVGTYPDNQSISWKRWVIVLICSLVIALLCIQILQNEFVAQIVLYTAALIILVIYLVMIFASKKRNERAGLLAAFILTIQTIFFFVFYQQMSTSLALFALRNTNLDFTLFGHHLWAWSPAQFQALNPIWVMLLSPLLAWLYAHLSANNRDFSTGAKFVFGFSMVAIGFFIYGAARIYSTNGLASSWVMIFGYGFYSLGELLVSGLGLAMIARYVPARICGFMMGVYFVATGISQYFGGIVANFASVPHDMTDPIQTLPIYTHLFNQLGFAALACTLLAIIILPIVKKLGNQITDEENEVITN